MFILPVLALFASSLVNPAFSATPSGDMLTTMARVKTQGTHTIDFVSDPNSLVLIPVDIWDYTATGCGDRTRIRLGIIKSDTDNVMVMLAVGTVVASDGKESALAMSDTNTDGVIDSAIVRGYTIPNLEPQTVFDTIIHCVATQKE